MLMSDSLNMLTKQRNQYLNQSIHNSNTSKERRALNDTYTSSKTGVKLLSEKNEYDLPNKGISSFSMNMTGQVPNRMLKTSMSAGRGKRQKIQRPVAQGERSRSPSFPMPQQDQKSLKSLQSAKPVKINKNFIKKFKEHNNINIKKLKPQEISFSKKDENIEKQKLVEKLERL